MSSNAPTSRDVDLSRTRVPSYAHQVVGVDWLTRLPAMMLADEMGAGKTKQVIDAAQALYLRGVINRVIVICPASVRSVWFDPELGQLAAHSWNDFPFEAIEYHKKIIRWSRNVAEGQPYLKWTITNYDHIRRAPKMHALLRVCDAKTMLVLDESTAVKSHKSLQTSACLTLRSRCGRVVLMTGTPVANSPADLFSQFFILNPQVLACETFYHFRSRYAELGGWGQKQIIGWRNLDDIQRRIAPFILRRLKSDCLDLPEKLPPVTVTVPLSEESWRVYKDMRDEMIAWLNKQEVSIAPHAAVKMLRLSQVTSGFVGGLLEQPNDDDGSWSNCETETREVGREKLDAVIAWVHDALAAEPNLKIVIGTRFRREAERTHNELLKLFPHAEHGLLWGGQKRDDRTRVLRLLDPRTMPSTAVIVAVTSGSGALGLNLTACHTVLRMSRDYSLFKSLQFDDRFHRPGQVHNVSYTDFIATGPQGQRTVDHAITKALHAKDDVARWTVAAWVSVVRDALDSDKREA